MAGPEEDQRAQEAVDRLNEATGQDYEVLDSSEERRDTNGR